MVDEMIDMLKLMNAKDNFVGGPFRKGISGGEKRRLNIGAELLCKPKILFLDEPTSGLDSYTAFVIVKLLRTLSRAWNMIVIYTIHQPTKDIYQLFDNLMILNKGKGVYFGKCSQISEHFQSMQHIPPAKANPLEFFIEVCMKSDEETTEALTDAYIKNTSIIMEAVTPLMPDNQLNYPNTKVGTCKQFKVLYKRALLSYFRSPKVLKIRAIQTVMLIIVYVLLYFQIAKIDPLKPTSLTNRYGALFFISVNLFMTNFSHTVLLCKLISSHRESYIYERVFFWFVRYSPVHNIQTIA